MKEAGGPWQRPASHFGRRLLILVAVAAIGLGGLFAVIPPTLISAQSEPRLISYGLIGLSVLAALAASRQSLARIGAQVGLWALFGLALVAGYGYRPELEAVAQRIMGTLLPSHGQSLEDGAVVFHRSADRQFWIDAVVNDVPVRFLVDTGAAAIVLSETDAARLGFSRDRLRFTQMFSSANGVTRGAPVRLDHLAIGPLTFDGLPASVNQGPMEQSLLGMRLLEQFSSLEIANDTLILRR